MTDKIRVRKPLTLEEIETINMDEITFHKMTACGKRREINVSLNGEPFGQMWTFKNKGEIHPWHAKPLKGEHKTFYAKDGGKEAAMTYMRGCV